MKAIILAAGLGRRLRRCTKLPKCLIKINGVPIIHRYIFFLKACGIKEIAIVVGYKKEHIIKEIAKSKDLIKIKVIYNPDFSKGSVLSLWKARHVLKQDTLIMDGDIYFEYEVIKRIFSSKKKNFFLIDSKAQKDSETVVVGFRNSRAVDLARGLKGDYDLSGEWAGCLKLSSVAAKRLKKITEQYVGSYNTEKGYEFIIPDLFKDVSISCELVNGLNWIEIDFPRDIKKAERMDCRNYSKIYEEDIKRN